MFSQTSYKAKGSTNFASQNRIRIRSNLTMLSNQQMKILSNSITLPIPRIADYNNRSSYFWMPTGSNSCRQQLRTRQVCFRDKRKLSTDITHAIFFQYFEYISKLIYIVNSF